MLSIYFLDYLKMGARDDEYDYLFKGKHTQSFPCDMGCKIEAPSVCINFPENIFTYLVCRWRSCRVNNSGLQVFAIGLSETKF